MRGVFQDTGGARVAKLMTAYLFKWQEVEAKSDLERLRLVLEHLPDETVMRRLEAHRKWGRDDYRHSSGVEFGVGWDCVSARECGIVAEGAFAKRGATRVLWV